MTALNLSSLSLLLLGLAYTAKGTIDTDVNSNAPVFERSVYVVELAENVQIGEKIVTVVAHDPDEGVNGEVSYQLHPWDGQMFTLNSRTGSLFSNMVVDREVYAQVNLTILAVDRGNQPMTGTTLVVVMITDVNDNAPELGTSEFSITEGSAPGRYVGRLEALDRDVGINGEVEFSMKIVSPRLPFHVSPDGQIRTASYSAIDREIQDTYILEILMKDKGSPSLTSTTSVTVHVRDVNNNDNTPELVTTGASITDVNDNAPELVSSEFSITEGNAPGRYVGMLVALDRHLGINGEVPVEFSMKIVSPRLPFHVSPDGQIRTASYSDIDREMQDTYILEILMKDKGSPSLTSTTSVTVNVMDVNDNAPLFMMSEYNYRVAENMQIGEEFARVIAHDPDEGINGVVSYYLHPSDNDMFNLNSRTGWLSFNMEVDREVVSMVNLIIHAVDGGDQPMTGTTSVAVMITDVNDNAPELLPSEFSITEGNAPRRYVGMLEARDRDVGINGEVEFSMKIVSPRLPFHVSPDGQIRTASYSAIDREIQDTYILEILMKDKGTPSLTSTASVTVHVRDVNNNDNTPELVTTGASITDVNDNAPELVSSEFSITEGNAPGRYVGMLVALDRHLGINGEVPVEFSMKIVSPRLPFHVSPDGQIRTASYSFIDREMQDTYVLEILMEDKGTSSFTSTASVTVHVRDVNDNAPVFMWSVYVVELAENAPIGEEIVRVVTHDPDEGMNGLVSYHLHPWDGEMFTLNSRTGSLFSNMVVDREVYSQLNLTILAVDGGDQPMTGTTSVVVMITDVNDNAPELVTSEFSITEGSAPRRYVGMLEARDRDVGINGEVEFSMKIVSPRLPFHVSPDGQIRTASYSAIEREIQDTYILEILMKDKGTPSLTSTASVTVHVRDVNNNDNTPELVTTGASITDVNDNAPELVSSEFSITEGNAPGRYVGMLVALDRHLGINGEVPVEFSMKIVSPRLPFHVSPDGQIRTASYSDIDREMQDTYILEILMRNEGTPSLTSTVSVTVHVIDVNDNAPVFPMSEYVYRVAENMQIGEEFARVIAHDPDEGFNGVVSYYLHPSDNDMFNLNSRTGWLSFNMEVDREVVSQVNLIIHAVDGGNQPMTGTTSVVVMITDVNDNAPELGTSEFSITEGSAPGRYVGRLEARDRDVGINGEVEFSMKIVSPRLPFHVSPDGQIRTASYSAIDREIQDTYILEIIMKDKGTPSLTSTASVTVHVSDIR